MLPLSLFQFCPLSFQSALLLFQFPDMSFSLTCELLAHITYVLFLEILCFLNGASLFFDACHLFFDADLLAVLNAFQLGTLFFEFLIMPGHAFLEGFSLLFKLGLFFPDTLALSVVSLLFVFQLPGFFALRGLKLLAHLPEHTLLLGALGIHSPFFFLEGSHLVCQALLFTCVESFYLPELLFIFRLLSGLVCLEFLFLLCQQLRFCILEVLQGEVFILNLFLSGQILSVQGPAFFLDLDGFGFLKCFQRLMFLSKLLPLFLGAFLQSFALFFNIL